MRTCPQPQPHLPCSSSSRTSLAKPTHPALASPASLEYGGGCKFSALGLDGATH
jgi:hypothetical protein